MIGTRTWALVLAACATGTTLCLSVLAGWQRGGSLAERLVWVAIGTVLVVSAHLLPALIRDAPISMRSVGSLLWGTCFAAACYGHMVFFVFAQQHAGERRAGTVTVADVIAPARSLTVVMSERANMTRQLALAQAQRCPRDCSGLAARRVTFAAKLDALNAEADDARRRQSAVDRVTAQRGALLADPVTARLAALLGTTVTRIDLLSGLAFAAVLEGVSCLLWTVALRAPPVEAAVPDVNPPDVTPVANVTAVTQCAVTPEAASHVEKTVSREAVTGSHTLRNSPVTLVPEAETPSDDVSQLVREIATGRLRPTVADIRRHLGCSQAKAAALRRQLAELTT